MILKDLLYFTKSDRHFLAVLFLLVIAVSGIMLFLEDDAEPDDVQQVQSERDVSYNRDSSDDATHDYPFRPVPFDPNTADYATLRSLGLSDMQARAVANYRKKGGTYQHPEEISGIPRLSKQQYDRMLPYVRISDDFRPAAELVDVNERVVAAPRDSMPKTSKIKGWERVAVNTADSATLCQIPGIGPYRAGRIIQLRKRLGGFYSLEQLYEIDGIEESSLQYMIIPEMEIRHIRINRWTQQQLRNHPYITNSQARDIFDYRRNHGNLQSVDDLRTMPSFRKGDIEKLEPYLNFN